MLHCSGNSRQWAIINAININRGEVRHLRDIDMVMQVIGAGTSMPNTLEGEPGSESRVAGLRISVVQYHESGTWLQYHSLSIRGASSTLLQLIAQYYTQGINGAAAWFWPTWCRWRILVLESLQHHIYSIRSALFSSVSWVSMVQ